jgi:hypothetical protein
MEVKYNAQGEPIQLTLEWGEENPFINGGYYWIEMTGFDDAAHCRTRWIRGIKKYVDE